MAKRFNHIRVYSLVEINELRKKVRKAFHINTGKELLITPYKESPYFTDLIENVSQIIGKDSPSVATFYNFFYEDAKEKYKESTINKIKEYIKKSLPSSEIDNEIIKISKIHDENDSYFADISPFDRLNEDYNILVLPFRNTEKYKEISPMGENLVEGLIAKNEKENLGLRIKYVSNYTPNDAERIGRWMNADLVIWGNDSKPDNTLMHHIYIHYMYILPETISTKLSIKSKTDKYEIERLIEITEGNTYLDIESIIYWFLGSKFYFKQDYNKALTYLKIIDKEKYNLDGVLFYLIANCYCFISNFNEAKNYFEKAIEYRPDFPEAHNNYSTLLLNEFNDVKGSEKHFLAAHGINPDELDISFLYF